MSRHSALSSYVRAVWVSFHLLRVEHRKQAGSGQPMKEVPEVLLRWITMDLPRHHRGEGQLHFVLVRDACAERQRRRRDLCGND